MPTPPAHTLHVFDPAHAGWPALVALSVLQHRPGHRLMALGASQDRRLAREFGIDRAEFCAAPARLAFSAAWCLRGALAAQPAPALVCAWSEWAARVASQALPDTPRTLVVQGASPSEAIANPEGGGARRTARTVMPVLIDPQRLPGPPGSRDFAQARAKRRDEWEVPADTAVVLALGEPSERIDARLWTYLCGVGAVAGLRVALVLPSTAHDLERAMRMTEAHNGWWTAIIDDRPPWHLLAGCDAAVWGAPQDRWLRERTPGVCGVAWARACGLPVIAIEHPASAAALAGDEGGRLARPYPTSGIVRVLLDVLGPGAARSLVDVPGPGVAPLTPDEWCERLEDQLGRARMLAPTMYPLPLLKRGRAIQTH